MSNTNSPRTGRPAFGRRGLIIGAAAIGFAIGGYTLASAAQGAFFDDNPSPSDLSVPGTDGTVVDDSGVDSTLSTVSSSTDDSTSSTIDDNGSDDNGTSTTIDDHGNDDDDDDNSTTTVNGLPLPDPFTETYTSTGGSITLTWTGTKFVIDSIDAAAGFTAEIDDQRWDRVRV